MGNSFQQQLDAALGQNPQSQLDAELSAALEQESRLDQAMREAFNPPHATDVPIPGASFFEQLGRDLTAPFRRGARVIELGAQAIAPETFQVLKPGENLADELQEALSGSASDALLTALTGPATRGGAALARTTGAAARATFGSNIATRTVAPTIRGATSFAPIAGIFTEAETPTERIDAILEGAAVGGVFGALAPIAGRVLEPANRFIKDIRSKLTSKVAESDLPKFLQQTERQAESLFARAFAGKAAPEILDKDLPELVARLNQELNAELSLAGQITERELGGLLEKGTLEGRASILRVSPAAETEAIKVSQQRIRQLKLATATFGGALRAAGKRLAAEPQFAASKVLREQFDGYAKIFNGLSQQFLTAGTVAGRALQEFQQPVRREMILALNSHLERFAETLTRADILKELDRTAFAGFVDLIKAGDFSAAAKTAISRIWRTNLFPLTSFVADSVTNFTRTAEKGVENLVDDVFDIVIEGKAASLPRTSALARAIFYSNPLGKQLDSLLNPTLLGESFGSVYGPILDRVLIPGAVLKRVVDSSFGRIGFLSSIYEDGLIAARNAGLSGLERTAFVRQFVLDAPQNKTVLNKAITLGQQLKFATPLPPTIAKVVDNPAVQLLITPFGRFSFQFTKWMSEHTPLSPSFWSKVTKGEATERDFLHFMVRNLEGMGAVHFANEVFYDNINFDRMEYITDDGRAVQLAGLSPLPEALAVAAIFRGDVQNAAQALRASSLGFFALNGLLGRMLSVSNDALNGRVDPSRVADEFQRAIMTAFPGRVVLETLKNAFDPTIREGEIVGRLPGLSLLEDPRINIWTGAELEAERFIARTDVPAPAAFGTRLTERPLDPVEAEYVRLDMEPPSTARRIVLPGLDKPSDIPDELHRFYLQQRGRFIVSELRPFIASPAYKKLTDAQKRERIREMMSRISEYAKRRTILERERLRLGNATIQERLENPIL